MDVQGAEMKVLNGAGLLLNNIKVIWMEVSDISMYKDQPFKNQIEKFMKSNGFILYIDKMEGHSGDQMYINSRFFKIQCFFLKLKHFWY
jgi:hypothetical protein